MYWQTISERGMKCLENSRAFALTAQTAFTAYDICRIVSTGRRSCIRFAVPRIAAGWPRCVLFVKLYRKSCSYGLPSIFLVVSCVPPRSGYSHLIDTSSMLFASACHWLQISTTRASTIRSHLHSSPIFEVWSFQRLSSSWESWSRIEVQEMSTE